MWGLEGPRRREIWQGGKPCLTGRDGRIRLGCGLEVMMQRRIDGDGKKTLQDEYVRGRKIRG